MRTEGRESSAKVVEDAISSLRRFLCWIPESPNKLALLACSRMTELFPSRIVAVFLAPLRKEVG